MEKRIYAVALCLCFVITFSTLSAKAHFNLKFNAIKVISTHRPTIKTIERVVNESTRNEWHQRELNKLMRTLRKKFGKKARKLNDRPPKQESSKVHN